MKAKRSGSGAVIAPFIVIVDTDRLPVIPRHFNLRGSGATHHRRGKVVLAKRDGRLLINGVEVVRYLSPNQQDHFTIQGHKLQREFDDKRVLNACILDELFERQEFIPEGWKDGKTYFWGTIFRFGVGYLYIEYLYWHDGRWDRGSRSLETEWNASEYAAYLGEALPAAA